MKSDFQVETVAVSALAQVPPVHALQFPGFGLAFQKTRLYDRYHRSRCPGNRLKRPAFGEFRMVRPKQHLRSLANRSGSCRLPATSTYGISYSRTALRFAQQSPLTRGQGMKTASAPSVQMYNETHNRRKTMKNIHLVICFAPGSEDTGTYCTGIPRPMARSPLPTPTCPPSANDFTARFRFHNCMEVPVFEYLFETKTQ